MTRPAGVVVGTVRRPIAPALGLLLVWLPSSPLLAQDTIPPAEQGVRIGITYTPGVRPGMLVLGGPREAFMDSVRAILRRDLDYSDRFELISLPGGDSLLVGIGGGSGGGDSVARVAESTAEPFVNYGLYAALGADFAVGVLPLPDETTAVRVSLFDVRGREVRRRLRLGVRDPGEEGFRMAVHRVADEVVRGATGEPGYAASRLLVLSRGRLHLVDTDGGRVEPLTPPDVRAFSPTWHPSGRRVAYTELAEGWGRIVIRDLETGERRVVPPTEELLNFAAAFSRDGEVIAFSRASEEGTDVYAYNLARDCCLQRLTVGRFSDNLSPTFSPDGRQVAFVSTRPGLTQVYVMSADGTGQELFAPFDWGVTGSSYAPEWSPDGTRITFHRDVAGLPQVFVMETRSRTVRQLTSAGRNEDPTWAPDGRHIAFISSRTGAQQVWVIDMETGRVRQLTRMGRARLPAWSPRLEEPTGAQPQP